MQFRPMIRGEHHGERVQVVMPILEDLVLLGWEPLGISCTWVARWASVFPGEEIVVMTPEPCDVDVAFVVVAERVIQCGDVKGRHARSVVSE